MLCARYAITSPGTLGLPKRIIFHDEAAVAARKWAVTATACYRSIYGSGADFDLDDVVPDFAIRTFNKRLICRFIARHPALEHGSPRA